MPVCERDRGRMWVWMLGDASQNSANPYCVYYLISDMQAMFLGKKVAKQ